MVGGHKSMLAWLGSLGSSAAAAATATTTAAGGESGTEEWPKVRILVLGDSGVGKTCLVERLVTGQVPSTPRWTLGCNVQVLVHTLVDQQTELERKIIVEFWDIGGHRNFSDSRHVFYHQINGVMLVHDYSNKKSFNNLKSWLLELEREDALKRQSGLIGVEEARFGRRAAQPTDVPRFKIADPPQHLVHRHTSPATSPTTNANATATASPLNGLPVLVVGNKCDSLSAIGRAPAPKMFTFDSVLTSALATTTTSNGPHHHHHHLYEQEKFNSFFHRVYDKRFN